MSTKGWIGVDLDGTLAQYDQYDVWRGISHVGEPVPKMVARVKAWLAAGKDVRIITARVSVAHDPLVVQPIQDWCLKHLGQILEITCKKDYAMIELWDDRCVQVIPNTGLRADGRE